jgi:hypothetical protein
MKVSVAFTSVAEPTTPVGAHELAWSYVLDTVVADAYTQRLAALHFVLPRTLGDDLALRTKLSTQARQGGGASVGAALLSDTYSVPMNAARLYTLEIGGFAAFTYPRPSPPASGWRVVRQLSIYCLPAYLWGVLIRAADLFGSRALSDWAMHRMRRAFARSGRHSAFYQLTIWGRA